jgi:uncharacterized protein DUF4824
MKSLRDKFVWSGIALLATINAVLLGSIVYNRETPESTLVLSHRELRVPYVWGFARENSGLALRIYYRTLPRARDGASPVNAYLTSGEAEWLDAAKLAELGIDVRGLAARSGKSDRRGGRDIAKEVLFVLELAGPAYEEALARARRYAESEAKLAAANPGKEEFKCRAEQAAGNVQREEREHSRLFIVDAGLDRETLRARYPDRQRYAIVRGTIQPHTYEQGVYGDIGRLSIGEINVPQKFRAPIDPPDGPVRRPNPGKQNGCAYTEEARAPFSATVVYGRRLEPWIETALVSSRP